MCVSFSSEYPAQGTRRPSTPGPHKQRLPACHWSATLFPSRCLPQPGASRPLLHSASCRHRQRLVCVFTIADMFVSPLFAIFTMGKKRGTPKLYNCSACHTRHAKPTGVSCPNIPEETESQDSHTESRRRKGKSAGCVILRMFDLVRVEYA